jgi:hypothetical protein
MLFFNSILFDIPINKVNKLVDVKINKSTKKMLDYLTISN